MKSVVSGVDDPFSASTGELFTVDETDKLTGVELTTIFRVLVAVTVVDDGKATLVVKKAGSAVVIARAGTA